MPTESQVFEDEVRPATERTDQPAEEMSERHDHGKNFSGKDRIKLCAKSFISQVYDPLARHNTFHQRCVFQQLVYFFHPWFPQIFDVFR
jgi:hypothetical protein